MLKIFLLLTGKLLPLYFLILLGYFAGRKLKVEKESIASLLIYFIAPVIVFHGVVTTKITLAVLSLPLVFFLVCSLISVLFLRIGKVYFRDATKNLLAMAAGSGNAGYFGLPVALSVFGERALGFVALIIMGFILYENTTGFFLMARGHHTVSESFRKLLRLPAVYAFLLGLIINMSGVKLGGWYPELVYYFRGAYTLLGMMMIGLGLSGVSRLAYDSNFFNLAFTAKFAVWPVIILLFINLDKLLFHLYTGEMYSIMLLMSLVPLAANNVAFASALKVHPEKAALAVLGSTLFALFYIPLMVAIFIK